MRISISLVTINDWNVTAGVKELRMTYLLRVSRSTPGDGAYHPVLQDNVALSVKAGEWLKV